MVAVSLCDTLEFAPEAARCDLADCSEPALSTGPENLVLRAANCCGGTPACRRGAVIRLTKRIPMQAGLGGGSSDAAATLVGLNRLWNLGLTVGRVDDPGRGARQRRRLLPPPAGRLVYGPR